MRKGPPLGVWLVAALAVILLIAGFYLKAGTQVRIKDIEFKDDFSTSPVSFVITNDSDTRQAVKVLILAERRRESESGSTVSSVGSKTVAMDLPPHSAQPVSYSLPLANIHHGVLSVTCMIVQ